MSEQDREREEGLVIRSADELLKSSTRRKFVRMLGMGGAIVMLPSVFAACDDDDDPTGVQSPPPPPNSPPPGPVTELRFDLRTDVGIFRFVHTLEIVERAFYTAVVTKANFATLFNADEQEVLRDIRNAETIHEAFLRNALGSVAIPDLTAQLNTTTLNAALQSRQSILTTANLLETTGVAGLNGAGKYLKDARNLLLAGKFASVEARHLAALRELQPPAGVAAHLAFADNGTIDANGLDIKLEAGDVLARVKSLDILNATFENNVTITNAPDAATQGAPTPNYMGTTTTR